MAKRKIVFKFIFEGDDDENSVVLMHTLNSGKKVVFLNGVEVHKEEVVRGGMGCGGGGRQRVVRSPSARAQPRT